MVGAAYRKSGPAMPTKPFPIGRVRHLGTAGKLKRGGSGRSSTGSPHSGTAFREDGRQDLARKLVDRVFDGVTAGVGLCLQGRFGLFDLALGRRVGFRNCAVSFPSPLLLLQLPCLEDL